MAALGFFASSIFATPEEVTSPKIKGYQSIYGANDIAPTSLLGTKADGELIISPADLGIEIDSGSEFARAFAILDDIDNNSVHEIFISAKFTSPLNKSQGHGVIVFLNENRSVQKVQFVDEAMLVGSHYTSNFSVRYGHRIGDFDGNGVTDLVLSENEGKSGQFRTILFGKADETTLPRYMVEDIIDHSNAEGNLPFILTSNAIFGSTTQPYTDTDKNGVMGFHTLISDVNGDLRSALGLSTSQQYFVFVQPGSVQQETSEVTFTPVSVASGAEVVGDMNGDDFPDIMTVIGNGRDWGVITHLSQGNINHFIPYTMEATIDGVPFAAINIIKSGDANNDGNIDIVLGGTITINSRPDTARHSILVLFYLDGNYKQKDEPVVLIEASEYLNNSDMWRTIHSGNIRVFDLDSDGQSEILLGNPHGISPSLHIRYFR